MTSASLPRNLTLALGYVLVLGVAVALAIAWAGGGAALAHAAPYIMLGLGAALVLALLANRILGVEPPRDHPTALVDKLSRQLSEREANLRWLEAIVQHIGEAVFVVTPDGLIRKANVAASALTGLEPRRLLRRPFVELLTESERSKFELATAAHQKQETALAGKDGSSIAVSMTGSCIRESESQPPIGCVFVLHDIRERKRSEQRIRYLASHDSLTRIPNRLQFQHSLQQAMARARRKGQRLAMLYLDLDRFKEVNDNLGHAAGDKTLEVLSERLVGGLAEGMTLGRLAGDEFGLYLEGLEAGTDHQGRVVDLARDLLSRLSLPFRSGAEEYSITASIGIALYPDDGDNVIDLMRAADVAMYQSKQRGGNDVSTYTPDMSNLAVEKLMLRNKLRQAVERDELRLAYQPLVDLQEGHIVGCEALLRWELPGHGLMLPHAFLAIAEESDLMAKIGDWVLRAAFRDLQAWSQRLPGIGGVAINLSLRQLLHADFLPRLQHALREHAVPAGSVWLEITETTMMSNPQKTLALLGELRELGLQLSIDDFGTGHSSLSSLRQYPVSTLKVDQSFIANSTASPEGRAMVKTILEMGRELGLEVVAEGIETAAQLRLLRALGCRYGQGHLFSQPLTAKAYLSQRMEQAQRGGAYRDLMV